MDEIARGQFLCMSDEAVRQVLDEMPNEESLYDLAELFKVFIGNGVGITACCFHPIGEEGNIVTDVVIICGAGCGAGYLIRGKGCNVIGILRLDNIGIAQIFAAYNNLIAKHKLSFGKVIIAVFLILSNSRDRFGIHKIG